MSKYEHTLNLPKTNFIIKNSPQDKERILKKWKDEKLYQQIKSKDSQNDQQSLYIYDRSLYINGGDNIFKLGDDISLLDNVKQTYHRIRNTTRYMLSNLYDFDVVNDLMPLGDMRTVDRYAVAKFNETYNIALEAYEDFDFNAVVKGIENACVVDLSSFYLEIIKDRLYNSPANSEARRSAQSALYRIVSQMIKVMAPIMCFTMEDAWHNFKPLEGSIHLQKRNYGADFPILKDGFEAYTKFLDLRHRVNVELEKLRANGTIGASREAEVKLTLNDVLGGDIRDHLEELLGVSLVEVLYDAQENIEVKKASGNQCQRCWKFSKSVGSYKPDDVCLGCSKALNE